MSTFSKVALIFPKTARSKLAIYSSNAYIEFFPEKKEAVERRMVTEDVVK